MTGFIIIDIKQTNSKNNNKTMKVNLNIFFELLLISNGAKIIAIVLMNIIINSILVISSSLLSTIKLYKSLVPVKTGTNLNLQYSIINKEINPPIPIENAPLIFYIK